MILYNVPIIKPVIIPPQEPVEIVTPDYSELLLQAASELAGYITVENERLRLSVGPFDTTLPDFHDFQTCQELAELAKTLKEQL